MVDIISSAKSTKLHTYPFVSTKHTYSHIANEPCDFQIYPNRNCILQINKKFGFELLHTINKNGVDIVQRIKKAKLDNLQCGAVPKSDSDEIAVGTTTGFVRIFDVQAGDFTPIKFKPDRVGNNVVALDYSNCDGHLAALYDSSDINLYGMKTGIKTDTFRCDGM